MSMVRVRFAHGLVLEYANAGDVAFVAQTGSVSMKNDKGDQVLIQASAGAIIEEFEPSAVYFMDSVTAEDPNKEKGHA